MSWISLVLHNKWSGVFWKTTFPVVLYITRTKPPSMNPSPSSSSSSSSSSYSCCCKNVSFGTQKPFFIETQSAHCTSPFIQSWLGERERGVGGGGVSTEHKMWISVGVQCSLTKAFLYLHLEASCEWLSVPGWPAGPVWKVESVSSAALISQVSGMQLKIK